jgi:YopX protein
MATQANEFYATQQTAKRQLRVRAWDRRTCCWIVHHRLVCTASGDLLVRALASHCYEISEFTGRTDLNGRDIYEGDIVRTLGDGHRVLTWNARGLWVLTAVENSPSSVTIGLWELREQDLEVVGNRYEAPELLIR